ncbi:hypothetical protein LINPERPRIM_LOCUS16317 [Linum perenne]
MRGAIEGLRRTWGAGYRKVLLQLDSHAAITLLSNEDYARHQHALETASFTELRDRDWELVIRHTYRGGNRAADYLVGIGYGYLYGSHNISTSNCNLGYFLHYYDLFGVVILGIF